MSGDTLAVAVAAAGLTAMVMGVLMTIALAYAYQGAHTRMDGPARDRRRCCRYHRLSRAERKVWRAQEAGRA